MSIGIGPPVGRKFWAIFSAAIVAASLLMALCLKIVVADRDTQGNLRRDVAAKLHDPTVHGVYSSCEKSQAPCIVGFTTANEYGTAKAVPANGDGWRVYSVKLKPAAMGTRGCVGAVR